MNRRSNIYRALMTNPGFAVSLDDEHVYARNLEVPSGGAVGTARAIAHAYGVFASADGSSGCARRRWTCSLRRRFLRPAGSTTSV